MSQIEPVVLNLLTKKDADLQKLINVVLFLLNPHVVFVRIYINKK